MPEFKYLLSDISFYRNYYTRWFKIVIWRYQKLILFTKTKIFANQYARQEATMFLKIISLIITSQNLSCEKQVKREMIVDTLASSKLANNNNNVKKMNLKQLFIYLSLVNKVKSFKTEICMWHASTVTHIMFSITIKMECK